MAVKQVKKSKNSEESYTKRWKENSRHRWDTMENPTPENEYSQIIAQEWL